MFDSEIIVRKLRVLAEVDDPEVNDAREGFGKDEMTEAKIVEFEEVKNEEMLRELCKISRKR